MRRKVFYKDPLFTVVAIQVCESLDRWLENCSDRQNRLFKLRKLAISDPDEAPANVCEYYQHWQYKWAHGSNGITSNIIGTVRKVYVVTSGGRNVQIDSMVPWLCRCCYCDYSTSVLFVRCGTVCSNLRVTLAIGSCR